MTSEDTEIVEWASTSLSTDRSEYSELDGSDFADRLDEIDTFFFVVGFPKAATSTIAQILYHQPEIRLPIAKEPYFFNTDEYELGRTFYWEKYFEDDWDGEPVVGEAATMNSVIPFVAKRIAKSFPQAKIVFSLRNPIDRAFSNWWMFYRSGREKLSFKEVMEWELKEQKKDLMPLNAEDDDYWHWYRRRQMAGMYFWRRTPRTYLMRGHYAHHIKRFQQYFDDDQLLYLFQDRLYEDRVQEMNKVFSFLDISETGEVFEKDAHVAPKHPLHGWVTNKLLPHTDHLPDSLYRVGSRGLYIVSKVIPGSIEMESDTRERLFDYYREKNKELEEIVDRDLSHWNESTRY